MKECLSAARVRLFSDTGAWKQTALRVALFSAADPRVSHDAAAEASGRADHRDGGDGRASHQPAPRVGPGHSASP